jgi:DNA-directed RNA polymerase specialized sigma24 family protein
MEPLDGISSSDAAALIRVVTRMALRWCATPADAEDVAQEAILRLLTQRRPPENVLPWLFVVTRRIAHRLRLRGMTRTDAELMYGARCRWVADDCDALLDVSKVLSRLAVRDRALLGCVVEGMGSSEIASTFHCHVRDVGQMVSRARRKANRLRNSR